jgi:ankyrin repeat protein
MQLRFQVSILSLCFVLASAALGAQNLKDDITNNDLEGLKSKVALLSPDFKDFAYICHYLRTADSYQAAMLDYLLAQGASPDQVDESGVGALYWAIAKDNLEAVNKLIAKKANVNAAWPCPKGKYWMISNSIGKEEPRALELFDAKDQVFGSYSALDAYIQMRPLAAALYSSDADIVSALLKAGADPSAYLYRIKDEKASAAKKTAVYQYTNTIFDHIVGRFAESKGRLDRVSPTFFANSVLVWKAAQALPKDRQPAIPKGLGDNLFAYFATGDMKSFKAELVKTGANTLTFLPYAALAENWDIVDLICQYNQIGLDDSFDEGGESLLSWAIWNLHTGAARMLLEHGAVMPKASEAESDGERQLRSPLIWAASSGKSELVKLLLEFKADPNEGIPLRYAQFNPEIRQLLLAAGAKPDALIEYDREGKAKASLLFDAASKGSGEAVAFWLAAGLDAQGELSESNQPLVAAVVNGHLEAVKALLAKGAAANVLLDERHTDLVKIRDFKRFQPLRDYAASLVDRAEAPLEKSRAKQIVKLLDAALASSGAKYKVGESGPAGGIVFFDKGYEGDGWRYLEAAPSDIGSAAWSAKAPSSGITGEGIGCGKPNTATIVAELGAGDCAASLCAAYTAQGFSDWFLPSVEELQLMFAALPKGSFAGGESYWSSSLQGDSNKYGYIVFSPGRSDYVAIYGKMLLRPIREFQ